MIEQSEPTAGDKIAHSLGDAFADHILGCASVTSGRAEPIMLTKENVLEQVRFYENTVPGSMWLECVEGPYCQTFIDAYNARLQTNGS
jgi:hypothetical protein